MLAQNVPNVWLENDLVPITVELRNPATEKDVIKGRLLVDFHDSATGRTLPVASDGVLPVYLLQSHLDAASLVPHVDVECPIKPGETRLVSLALRFVTFGEQTFFLRFDYETAEYASSSKLLVPVKVHKPFSCKFQLHRDTMQPLPSRTSPAWVNRPLLVSSILENVCDVNLSIGKMALVVEDERAAQRTSGANVAQSAVELLQPHGQCTWWESLQVLEERPETHVWGHLQVHWKNLSLSPSAEVMTKIPLPPFMASAAPFFFSLEAPATAEIGQSFNVTVRVSNNSDLPHQMFLFTRERRVHSEVQSYVFDGKKSEHFKIFPRSTWEAHYKIIALVAGELPLPSFVVKSKRDNTTVEGSERGQSVTVLPSRN